jgi:hypothetical protein
MVSQTKLQTVFVAALHQQQSKVTNRNTYMIKSTYLIKVVTGILNDVVPARLFPPSPSRPSYAHTHTYMAQVQ